MRTMNIKIHTAAILALSAGGYINAYSQTCEAHDKPIDRQAVVSRNNPTLTALDTLGSLSVGNGHFAVTVDVTGLQSYTETYANGIPLDAMSDWGWHSFINDKGLSPEESQRAYDLHGRQSMYAVEYKDGSRNADATTYFRVNPHRLNLGCLGLRFTDGDKSLPVEEVKDVCQQLDLWDGNIGSQYTVNGQPVTVTTAVLPERDCLIAEVVTPLFTVGDAELCLRFSYPTGQHSDDANDWERADAHTTEIVMDGEHYAVVERTLDDTRYYATILWDGNMAVKKTDKHTIALIPADPRIRLAVEYTEAPPHSIPSSFDFDRELKLTSQAWERKWMDGGIVDFGACTDPRAKELERRVILSQYLTKINCANRQPPQETGLTYNSWFGRPHLEMTWWHAVDFALWSDIKAVEDMLDWYNGTAYEAAKALAERQNFDGVRWLKMTDPWSGEAPSNTGSFLIWQQPHYIYLAEEVYRAKPTPSTLDKYAKQVYETAAFMADYAEACRQDSTIRLFGQTAMQESMTKDFSYHHPFEQAYWLYGLQTAQTWRERQGLERNSRWDEIIGQIAPLAVNTEGIYASGLPLCPFADSQEITDFDPFKTPDMVGKKALSTEDFTLKSRSDHPAVLGACGLLPDTTLYDSETMAKTLDWVMSNWNWPTTWGWDYGMIAMAAARLGKPETAIEALLIDKGKNTYLVNGHNYQEPKRLRLYLPGNGALLTAVAMMCAGWDGSTATNPGFPTDGTWTVSWEGLQPMQ